MRLLSWNMARVQSHWGDVAHADGLDVALLQEAVAPPGGVALETIPSGDASWTTAGGKRPFCAAIARLSDRVSLKAIPTTSLAEAGPHVLGVSLQGTLAACEVSHDSGETITVASIYGAWSSLVPWKKGGWIFADASVHRLISDLSALVASQRGHRVIVAGDLNILHGHGEDGNDYWRARYQTVFDRMAAIGLSYVGPQYPHGEQCSPWPAELPRDSKNVPTFRTRKADPSSATRQLDFVFASHDLAGRLLVQARNSAEEWGPSDHCRVDIEVDPR